MDAIMFLKEFKRMCDSIECCKCAIDEKSVEKGCSCMKYAEDFPEETVDGVEKWSKENPLITNGMKFSEVFGRPHWSIGNMENWMKKEYEAPEKRVINDDTKEN